MTRVLLAAVVVAQVLDVVTWMAMPRAAEINPLAQGLHSSSAWLLKSALVLLVFALDEVVRIAPPPKYPVVAVVGRQAAELVVVLAIAAGCIGAGSNLAVITYVAGAETPRSAPEPAPIASEATGIEQGQLEPAAPARIPAPRLVRHEAPDIPRGTKPLRGRASWVRATLGPRYLAARMPKGTLLRVCGAIGCTEGVVNDYGPSRRVFPDRIVDLSRASFAAVCGDPDALGTCAVTVWRLERLQLPATDR